MTVRAVVVTVPPADTELASDVLWSLGVVAIEERVVDDMVELWTSLGDSGFELEPLMSTGWTHRVEVVDDAVVDTWRAFAGPVHVAPGLVVRPAWQPDVAETGTVISIDPGSTFGMGDHPTTRLALRALLGMVRSGDRVLDVGCGSGVLAIAALRLGAASATAIDIAPAAVPVTRENAARNGVTVDVSNRTLAAIEGPFDVVVANILAPVLIELADDLRRVTGRVLIISGVLDGAFDHVLAALEPMVPVDVETLDGWAAVSLRGCSPTA